MVQHDPHPLPDLLAQRGVHRLDGARALGDTDPAQQGRREQERAPSTTSGQGRPSACTRAPPTAGPATNEADRVVLSSELASTYWSRRTRFTKNGCQADW